jgi:hypothetical protein
VRARRTGRGQAGGVCAPRRNRFGGLLRQRRVNEGGLAGQKLRRGETPYVPHSAAPRRAVPRSDTAPSPFLASTTTTDALQYTTSGSAAGRGAARRGPCFGAGRSRSNRSRWVVLKRHGASCVRRLCRRRREPFGGPRSPPAGRRCVAPETRRGIINMTILILLLRWFLLRKRVWIWNRNVIYVARSPLNPAAWIPGVDRPGDEPVKNNIRNQVVQR